MAQRQYAHGIVYCLCFSLCCACLHVPHRQLPVQLCPAAPQPSPSTSSASRLQASKGMMAGSQFTTSTSLLLSSGAHHGCPIHVGLVLHSLGTSFLVCAQAHVCACHRAMPLGAICQHCAPLLVALR